MSSPEINLEEELYELVHNLSTGLGIQPPHNLLDINFVIECLNGIMPHFREDWQEVPQQQDIDNEDPEQWREIIALIQDSFLDEGQQIVRDDQQIDLPHILQIYEILSQVIESLRQESLKPKNHSSAKKKRQEQRGKSNQKQQRQTKKEKKRQQKKQKKIPSREPPAQKQNKKPQSANQSAKKPMKNQAPKPKAREKIHANPQLKNLQMDVIETINKTVAQANKKKNDPKRQARLRDQEGTEALAKAKRTLDYTVKQFQKQNRRQNKSKRESKEHKSGKPVIDLAYMKMIAHKHKTLNEQARDQQLRYYLQLRDKKIAYIQNIHKLIEKLQRQRQIDQQKQERQLHLKKKKQMHNKIQTVDNLFRQNIEQLQENYEKKKQLKNLQRVNELNVCREIDRDVRKQKEREIGKMRDVWEAECKNLQMITGNQQKLKEKLYDIYRKGRV